MFSCFSSAYNAHVEYFPSLVLPIGTSTKVFLKPNTFLFSPSRLSIRYLNFYHLCFLFLCLRTFSLIPHFLIQLPYFETFVTSGLDHCNSFITDITISSIFPNPWWKLVLIIPLSPSQFTSDSSLLIEYLEFSIKFRKLFHTQFALYS